MLLLSPGPVPIEKGMYDVALIEQLPYFRGENFAEIVLEVTENMKCAFQTKFTPLTITASGTGLMEMAIVNLLDQDDKVIVINGGTFGQKWISMCRAFNIVVKEFKVELGKTPDYDRLNELLNSDDINALLINVHETSTGYLYDIRKISEMVHEKDTLFITDAVSSIGADDFQMDEWHVDCAMVSTQKALALMPGLGFIVFNDRAQDIIKKTRQPRFYFDALDYSKNILRGMTPFTPAMNVILQVRERVKQLKEKGIDNFIEKHAELAKTFRDRIIHHEVFGFLPERPSNALTAITLPPCVLMSQLVKYMKDEYNWWFAPNPTNREDYLRISHMGNLSNELMIEIADKISYVVKQQLK